jgi:hypothetical protein
MKRLFLAGMLSLATSMAHADDWQQRAKEAVAGPEPGHQACVLYVDLADSRLHVRVPVCFYDNGDVYLESYSGELGFTGIKAGVTHPAIPCAETIEGVERVDPTTFLVRLYCERATPQHGAVTVQLVDGIIHIRDVEAY